MIKKCIKCPFEGDESLFVKGGNICKNCHSKYCKNYYEKNKEKIAQDQKEYYENNKEQKAEYSKEYRKKENKEEKAIYNKSYYEKNKDQIDEYKKNFYKEKRLNDMAFKVRLNISRHINRTIKENNGSKNNISILEYLPYSINELIIYIENQFESWMTWENKGSLWHLDHIVPQSYLPFDSMDRPNFQKAWALKNLRPLEAKRNIKEKNRIKPDQDIEKMTQEDFENYIEVYLENYNKQKGNKK